MACHEWHLWPQKVKEPSLSRLKHPDIPGPWLGPPLQPRRQSHQLGYTAVSRWGMLYSFQLQAIPLLPYGLGLKAAERFVCSESWCEGSFQHARGVPRSLGHLREYIHRALSIMDIVWLFSAGAPLFYSRSTWSSFPYHRLGPYFYHIKGGKMVRRC